MSSSSLFTELFEWVNGGGAREGQLSNNKVKSLVQGHITCKRWDPDDSDPKANIISQVSDSMISVLSISECWKGGHGITSSQKGTVDFSFQNLREILFQILTKSTILQYSAFTFWNKSYLLVKRKHISAANFSGQELIKSPLGKDHFSVSFQGKKIQIDCKAV